MTEAPIIETSVMKELNEKITYNHQVPYNLYNTSYNFSSQDIRHIFAISNLFLRYY